MSKENPTYVTVPCDSIVQLSEYVGWLKSAKCHERVGFYWTTVDRKRCLCFSFDEEKDATLFILRWV